MNVFFATTCKGRALHVKETLPRNLADNPGSLSRFLILNYGSQDDLLDYLISNHKADLKSGKLILYSYATNGKFAIAHAKNLAARLAIREGAEILVTLDADNFTGPDFDRYLLDQFASSGMFMCPDHATIRKDPNRPSRGYAGRLAVRAQDFIKAGGYNELYDTWRGEDIDFNARMLRMGYDMRFIDVRYLNAIPHSARDRFAEYPHARQYETEGAWKLPGSGADTVVNNGKFGMGTVVRNFDPTPIELGPVPTRVFGIGLHKTATTSLDKAFQILGFDSLHWGTGEAPMIWHEMLALRRSKTLERFYALSDLPIPLLYRGLDNAYPGSKFILTIRDEEKWVKSVERLWDRRYNPSRGIWDVYPFSNMIHTVLYGQKDFDAEVMLKRYRRHNAEVLGYFRERPGDLLVLHVEGANWDRLCPFLGQPIPDVPFPWEYKTRTLALPVFEAAFCSSSDGADAPDELTEAPDVLFPSADHVPVPKPPLGKIRILAPAECPNCGAPDWNSSLPDEPAECRFCRNASPSNVAFRPSLDPVSLAVMRPQTPVSAVAEKNLLRRLLAFLCHLLAVISRIFRS
jgi:hypothetical protein